jgi:hypothetical protein
MSRRTIGFTLAALSSLVISCGGSQNSQTARQQAPEPHRRASEVITAEELDASGESNVYLAVQRLRPQWLRARPRGSMRLSGPEPAVIVYIDATRFGTLSSLQSLTVGGIYEIRRYDASEATNRFGTGHTNGAIVVRMSKP